MPRNVAHQHVERIGACGHQTKVSADRSPGSIERFHRNAAPVYVGQRKALLHMLRELQFFFNFALAGFKRRVSAT
jgi:hypothetical protein